jgi:hypothetical protein
MKRLISITSAIALPLCALAGVTALPVAAADNCSKMQKYMEDSGSPSDLWSKTNIAVVMSEVGGPPSANSMREWNKLNAKMLGWSKNSETKSLLKGLASKVKRGAPDVWDVYYQIQDNIDFGKC